MVPAHRSQRFRLGFVLSAFALLGGCNERIVYVYADGSSPPPADASGLDSGTDDGGGASETDAWTPPPGACEPNRSAGAISSADCRRYVDRPVCDSGLDDDPLGACVALPTMYCAPCETDAQCADGVDLRAECVFIPHVNEHLNDQACLSPCTSDDDCAFLNTTGIWLPPARCASLPRGTYCTVPFSDGVTATCSDFAGGRREDGE